MIVDKNSAFLVVVDIQEKLIPAIYNKEDVIENTKKLLKLAEIYKIPVIITEQYPKGLGKTVDEIEKAISSKHYFLGKIEKMTFSCCRETEFCKVLERLKKEGYTIPIICGIEAHICVYQTIADLMNMGYTEINLISDAIGSRKEENHRIIMDLLIQKGVLVKPTETVIFEVLEASGTPQFKEMLPYLK